MPKTLAPALQRDNAPTASNSEILAAQATIEKYLRSKARRYQTADREDIAATALYRWRIERKNTPAAYAERALLDFVRKAKRRATEPSGDPPGDETTGHDWQAVEQATVERLAGTGKPPGKVTRAPRVRRYFRGEEAELKAAVRVECLKQFRKRVRRDWSLELERRATFNADQWEDHKTGCQLKEEFRLAALKLVKYVKRPGRRGPVPLGLGWWVPEFVEPLTEHAFMTRDVRKRGGSSRGRLDHRSGRHRLVATWDAHDVLGLTRALNATEYAIVWLLSRGWPDGLSLPSKSAAKRRGLTPSDVIQAEARTFREVIEAVGRNLKRA